MSKKAMKLAKAWFERNTYGDEAVDVYEALCAALAEQPAQQALDKMAENARELGIQMQPEEPRAWFTVDELNAWADKKLKENPQWAEQPAQQEPVAWYDEEYDCAYTAAELDGGNVDGLLPLYTSPPARKPLTDDQKEKLWCDKFDGDTNFNSFYSITEAIEAAHGIKENT